MREGTVWEMHGSFHSRGGGKHNSSWMTEYKPLTEEELNQISDLNLLEDNSKVFVRKSEEVMTQSYSVHPFSLLTFQSQIKGIWDGAAGLALTVPLCWRVTVNHPNREPLVLDEESKGTQLGWKSLTNRQTQVFLNIDLFLNILRKRDWNKKQIKKNGNREREKNWKSCTETICTGLN